MLHKINTIFFLSLMIVGYEAQTLFGLVVLWCRTSVMSDIDTTPTLIIILNYMIFFSRLLISCVGVSVFVSCPCPYLYFI